MFLSTTQLYKIIIFLFVFLFSFFGLLCMGRSQTGWKWGVRCKGNFEDVWGGSITDASGNVYVAAGNEGPDTAILGTIVVPYTGNKIQLLITKADSSGNFLWQVSTNNNRGHSWPLKMVTDAAGNLYVLGVYWNDSIFSIGSYTITDTAEGICFLLKIAPSGTLLWAKKIAGGCPYSGYYLDFQGDMGIDGAGYIYVSDAFGGHSTTIGTTVLLNTGATSMFLAKLDTSGHAIWAKSFSDGSVTGMNTIAVTNTGNIYLSGNHYWDSTLVLGGYSLHGDNNFLAMFDSSGTVIWANNFDAPTTINAMTTDGAGNLYVTGALTGPYTLGPVTFSYEGGYTDMFVAKYSPSGTVIWANSGGGSGSDQGWGITVDYCGNTWVTGQMGYGSTFYFYRSALAFPPGGSDATFIARYDNSGNYVSSQALPSGGDDQSNIVFDGRGNFYLSGDYQSVPIVFGRDTLPADLLGGESLFIAKYKYDSLPGAGIISGAASVCLGSTTTLTDIVTGGVWSASNSHATITGGVITTLAPGLDTISYSVTSECNTYTATHIIAIDTNANAGVVTGPSEMCADSSITLSDLVTGGVWSSSISAVASVFPIITGTGVTGRSGGTTIISYSVTNACNTATAVHAVAVNPAPNAGTISGPSILCADSTIVLSDLVTAGTWSSSNTGIATVSSGAIRAISAGTAIISYSVASASCGTATVTKAITIEVPPSAGGISGLSTVCVASTTTLSDPTTGGVWSSNNTGIARVTSGVVTGISAGTATISYSVTNICKTAVALNNVTVNPLPNAGAITGPAALCADSTITLTDPAVSGAWRSGNTAIATVSGGVVTGITAGTATISYSVTSASCGSATASKTITVNPLPKAGQITGDSILCFGTAITLADTVTGGAWGSSNTSIARDSGGTITVLSAGIVTFNYSVATALCGTATANKAVTINPLPFAGTISGGSAICLGGAITLSDTATGGAWSTSNRHIGSVSGGIVTGVATGIDTVEYIVSNGCGTDTASNVVTVYPLPDAGTITGDTMVCKGVLFILSDTITSGIWSCSNTNVATIDSSTGAVYGLSLGTTIITYSRANTNGCINRATFSVSISAGFTISGAVTQISCYGMNNGSIATTITESTGPDQYVWSRGDSTSSIDSLAPGTYVATVKDKLTQCVVVDSFVITQPDSIALLPDVRNDSCKAVNGSISVTVSGGSAPYRYLWSNNATGSEITGLQAGIYQLTVTDVNMCAKDISVTVTEDSCNGINIHDAITPNGDGINDVWIIEGLQDYPKNTVQVFDKWGNLLYEQNNYNNDWGGHGSNGALLPDGTYFYLVKLNAENIYGGKNLFTGAILIKR